MRAERALPYLFVSQCSYSFPLFFCRPSCFPFLQQWTSTVIRANNYGVSGSGFNCLLLPTIILDTTLLILLTYNLRRAWYPAKTPKFLRAILSADLVRFIHQELKATRTALLMYNQSIIALTTVTFLSAYLPPSLRIQQIQSKRNFDGASEDHLSDGLARSFWFLPYLLGHIRTAWFDLSIMRLFNVVHWSYHPCRSQAFVVFELKL